MKTKIIQIQINTTMMKYQAGTTVPIVANEKGVPVERFWRK